jgi:hypothetical protein
MEPEGVSQWSQEPAIRAQSMMNSAHTIKLHILKVGFNIFFQCTSELVRTFPSLCFPIKIMRSSLILLLCSVRQFRPPNFKHINLFSGHVLKEVCKGWLMGFHLENEAHLK